MNRWPQRPIERLVTRSARPNTDACWPYQGVKRYGNLSVKGRPVGAHVVALELYTGEKANGRRALHICDNPPCVNPRHLRWGTQSQNLTQAYESGRRVGTTKPRSLTPENVRVIRSRYADGATQILLAKEFGVTQPLISQIVNRQRWGKCA